MKVVICGPRDFNDYDEVLLAIEKSEYEITEVVSGGAKGVDSLGEKWARENDIPIKRFLPDWKDLSVPNAVVKENSYGKYNAAAGSVSNEKMAFHADAVIAVVHGETRGTADMIKQGKEKELEVYQHIAYESDFMDAVGKVDF